MSGRTLGACAGVLAAVSVSRLPFRDDAGARSARPTPAVAAHLRDDALRHARTRLGALNRSALTTPPPDPTGALTNGTVTCRFVLRVPAGTTPKFDCELAGGEVIRVKYGHEPEIHAEVAAARLLAALGYAADREYLVPRLRCHGCPPQPFIAMRALELIGAEGVLSGEDGYTDFEWVAVERKFDAPPIEDAQRTGWAWWELKDVSAPREELDALRLLAVFLAHWDNKDENQRLVCMDPGYIDGNACRDPLLMIQDLGSTFGPLKVNLSQWRETPLWSDRATCVVSMRALPYGGSTFSDARISDAARVRLGRELAAFSDAELAAWFAAARFPQFYSTTDDEKDVQAWIDAYRRRVSQMLEIAPCPQ